MKLLYKIVSIVLVSLLLASSIELTSVKAFPGFDNEKTYIVRFKDIALGEQQLNKIKSKNSKSMKKYNHISAAVATLNEAEYLRLSSDINVESIEEDHPVKAVEDSFSAAQQWIQVPYAQQLGFTGSGTKIAILDTGVNLTSSELNIAGGSSFVPEDPTLQDMNGHGTRVAGIIGASKNGQGLIGIAPGSTLYAVKVLDHSGVGTYSQVMDGIEWAIDNDMDIVNMSFAGDMDSPALRDLLQKAYSEGMTLIAASGNEGRNSISYPAKYDTVIAVGSVDEESQLASFSNYGPDLDLVAPGVDIQSLNLDGKYVNVSGTSYSASLVTGVAALVQEANGILSNAEIRNILISSATSIGNDAYGAIDSLAAVQLAINGLNLPHMERTLETKQVSQDGTNVEKLAKKYKLENKDVQELLDLGYTLQDVQNAMELKEIEKVGIKEALGRMKRQVANRSKDSKRTVLNDNEPKTVIWRDEESSIQAADVQPSSLDGETLVNLNTNVDQAPYSVGVSGENISTLDGSLTLSSTDMTLPGRNGLGFALTRVYNSSDSIFYDIGREYRADTYKYQVQFNGSYQEYRALFSPVFQMKNYKWYTWLIQELISQDLWSLNVNSPDLTAMNNLTDRVNVTEPNYNSSHFYEYVPNTQEVDITGSENIGSMTSSTINSSVFDSESEVDDELSYIMSKAGNFYGRTILNCQTSTDCRFRDIYIDQSPNAYVAKIPMNEYPVHTSNPTYEEKNYPIGKGWSWNLPYIKVDSGTIYAHLAGGGTYEVSGSTLKGYPWKDVTFSSASGTVSMDGISYEYKYMLSNIQGIKYYFNLEGKLLQIKDAYNNYINFYYTFVAAYNTKLLNQIKDPLGNEINISYSKDTVTISSGDRTVKYNKVACGVGCESKELLESVDDPLLNKTSYQYEVKNDTRYNMLGTDVSRGVQDGYALLKIVTHPTGAESHYQYETLPVTRYVGPQSVMQSYRVKSRQDHIIFTNGTYDPYNHLEFTYNGDFASSYGSNSNFSTVVNNGTTSTQFSYDRVYNNSTTPTMYYKTEEVVYKDTGVIRDSKKASFEYNRAALRTAPTKITSQTKKEDISVNPPTLQSSSTPIIVSVQYDDFGNVTSITDPNLMVSTSNYDATGLLSNTTKPIVSDGSNNTTKLYSEVVQRNVEGDVEVFKQWEQIWAPGAEQANPNPKLLSWTETAYDIYGNMSSQTIKNSDGTEITNVQYTYCYMDNYSSYSDCPQTTSDYNQYQYVIVSMSGIVYDSIQKMNVTKTIKQKGKYEKLTGLIAEYTDGKQNVTTYTTDKLGRIDTIILPSDTGAVAKIDYDYDDKNNLIQVINEERIQTYTKFNPLGWMVESGYIIGGANKAKSKIQYDDVGRTISTEDAIGNEVTYEYDSSLDPFGRLTKVYYPDDKEKEETQRAPVEYTYDDINWSKTITDRAGNKVKETYDNMGQLVKTEDPSLNKLIVGMEYDWAGHLIKSTDGNHNSTTYGYDAVGHLTAVETHDQKITSYLYDLAGRAYKTIYPGTDGRYTEKKYDGLGRMLEKKDQAGNSDIYGYDENGNVVYYQDRNKIEMLYDYNKRNWLKSKSSPMETVTYQYNLTGARTSMEDLTGVTQWHYYPETGQLQNVIYPQGETITYSYDENGDVSTMKDPFGKTIEYGINNLGLVEKVRAENNDLDAYASFTFIKGRLDNYVLNDQDEALTGGLTTSYTYDGIWLDTITQKKTNGGNYSKFDYHNDDNGNIDQRSETTNMDSSTPKIKLNSYTYDVLNRIDSVYNTLAPNGTTAEKYTYDDQGNRSTITSSEPLTMSDASYTYDQWNRLTEVSKDGRVVSYSYNGDGLLYERKEDTQTIRYYYDGEHVIAEGFVDSEGKAAFKARYVRANGKLLAREDTAGKAFYLLNGHGDVIELRDTSGNLLNQYTYDIWGNPVQVQESVENPFRYSGEYWDSSTGLQYLRARWYDPSMGQFINEDTYEGDITNPLTLNLYTYVKNNPLKYIDPTGHMDALPECCSGQTEYEGNTPNIFKNLTNGILNLWNVAGTIIDTLFISDITTVLDPESSSFDKTLAAAGFMPLSKLVKGGKLIVTLASDGKLIERITDATDDALKAAATLSKKQTKHILNGHMPNEYAKQIPYLSDDVFKQYIDENTFFNPNWSREEIISGVEEAYTSALKNEATGQYDYYYNGEFIRLFVDNNGNLSSAYGLNKLDSTYFNK